MFSSPEKLGLAKILRIAIVYVTTIIQQRQTYGCFTGQFFTSLRRSPEGITPKWRKIRLVSTFVSRSKPTAAPISSILFYFWINEQRRHFKITMPATPPRIKDFTVCNVAAYLRKQRTEIKEGTSIVESFSRKSLLNRRQISIFLPSALYQTSKEASAYVFNNISHKYHTLYGKLKNPRTYKMYLTWKKIYQKCSKWRSCHNFQ